MVQWERFLTNAGIDDIFLGEFDKAERVTLLSAFVASIRGDEGGETSGKKLCFGTVSATLNNVCSSFRAHLRDDPSLEPGGGRALVLKRQLKGYKDEDKGVKHQSALPLRVFEKIWNNKLTHLNEAMGQLIVGALFFGMRSCEYLKVSGGRKTKLLRLKNVRFFQDKSFL